MGTDLHDIKKIIDYREKNYKIIPIINSSKKVINIINFTINKSFLPIDVVIMAGGRGMRLSPLTDFTPKPLLKIGNKPILEHIIIKAKAEGFINFVISIHYLGHMIEKYFGSGAKFGVNIEYLREISHFTENQICDDAISVIVDYLFYKDDPYTV